MKSKRKQFGLTLTEMIIVITVATLLAVFAVPGIRALINSLGSSPDNVKGMISAALASARAMAAKEQRYVGVRFQKAYPEGLKDPQYMIFIKHDYPETDLANGFRAIDGIKPIKLPENIVLKDKTGSDCFSVVFSASGKLIIHLVRAVNKKGNSGSNDDVFNTESQIQDGIGSFLEDTAADEKPSCISFAVNNLSEPNDYKVVNINPYMGTLID